MGDIKTRKISISTSGLDEVVNKQPAYRSEDVLECQNEYASGNLIYFEFISLYYFNLYFISVVFVRSARLSGSMDGLNRRTRQIAVAPPQPTKLGLISL